MIILRQLQKSLYQFRIKACDIIKTKWRNSEFLNTILPLDWSVERSV